MHKGMHPATMAICHVCNYRHVNGPGRCYQHLNQGLTEYLELEGTG